MNSIIMEVYIKNVKSNISHLFVSKATAIGYILESSLYVIFDIIKELYSFCSIYNNIWSSSFWSEVPKSLSIIFVPIISRNKGFNFIFSI